MKTILIVDDESKIREFVGLYFRADGFQVLEASDGEQALHIFQSNQIDLVILDILMSGLSGFDTCRELRRVSDVPVIILTALNQDEQSIRGYELGADDYISKSVNPKIIVAKAKRLLERQGAADFINVGTVCVDISGARVIVDGVTVDFSPKEFQVLALLMRCKNRVLSREYILNQVWGYNFMGDTRVVDTHIKKIRQKLGEHSSILKTVVSMGYKIEGT